MRFLGHQVPVAVRVNLLNRCHSRCRYCSFWHTPTDELSTDEWLAVFEELAGLGTRRVSISGGEPTLREDFGAIVSGAADQGLSLGLNSTGHRFDRWRHVLPRIDLFKLSLDGRPEVHDRIRGYAGAFDELLAAMELLRELDKPFMLTVTLTADALPEVPWLLDFAREQGARIAFQPVIDHGHAHRTTRSTFPDKEAFLGVVDLLQEVSSKEPELLRNTHGALEAIRAWPDFGGVQCVAGKAFVMIEANGDVVPCDRISYEGPIPSLREHGVAGALERLPAVDCGGCGFLGSLELNRIMAGQFDAGLGALRLVGIRRPART